MAISLDGVAGTFDIQFDLAAGCLTGKRPRTRLASVTVGAVPRRARSRRDRVGSPLRGPTRKAPAEDT
ncbi:MAG: hypothetical protein R2849_13455 [Thermomicrobiales bacterium]